MDGLSPRDGNRVIDWSGASADYARWRPTYPASLFAKLRDAGVGLPDQRILDLGTGVGFLAREFARGGSRVTGIDVAENQIEHARRLAAAESLDVDFHVTRAEDFTAEPGSFDVVSAGQCWLYFDHTVVAPAVRRWLHSGGKLVTCHFSWLAREDEIAHATEELVLRHNPDWSAADWPGIVPERPRWMTEDWEVETFLLYDEPIPFTHESWRGRIRASRGIGATLSPDAVATFDREHAELLTRLTPNEFTVLHRIDAHVMVPAHRGQDGGAA